ncbi:uncharacterized protein [Euphorbia lathyris]|uniref:uncharacterized protein n=1 Tax=Euphorbia lathyris TaxID=212925 RepID=UPI003313AA42
MNVQVANPSKRDEKRPLEGDANPPSKKTRSAAAGGEKLLANAMNAGKPMMDWLSSPQEQVVNPDLGKYWVSKYGAKGSLGNEAVVNDLDEAIGQLGEVQENQTKFSGSDHGEKGSPFSLCSYARNGGGSSPRGSG